MASKRWRRPTRSRPSIRAASTCWCSIRSTGRQHRRQRLRWAHLQRAARAGGDRQRPRRDRGRLPAARGTSGRRLCAVTGRRRCWCCRWQRRGRLHARPPGRVHAHHPAHPGAGRRHEFAINTSNSRFQETAGQALRRRVPAGKTGPRGKDFNMRWIASMVAEAHRILMRGGVHVPAATPRIPQAGPAAPAARGQPDRLPPGAGRRAPAPGGSRCWRLQPTPCTSASAGVGRRTRSSAHRALPRRNRPQPVRETAVRRARAVPSDSKPARLCTARPLIPGRSTPGPDGTSHSASGITIHHSKQASHVGTQHPIIAITGSSGAGTSSVTRTFENIFRANVKAALIEGDSFHRYDRLEMRASARPRPKAGNKHFSHFGAENNLFPSWRNCSVATVRRATAAAAVPARPGRGRPLPAGPGHLHPWEDLPEGTDLLFYEGLHGAVVTPEVNIARHPDLLIGVVPVINLSGSRSSPRQARARLQRRGGDRHHPAPHA